MRLAKNTNGSVPTLANGSAQEGSADCVPCCAPPPFTSCGTVCSRTSAWWPGRVAARLQASFSGVTIASSQTGPSFILIPYTLDYSSATFPAVSFTTPWAVSSYANHWPYFNASRPSGFWDRWTSNAGDTDCFDANGPFDATRICDQISTLEAMGNAWTASGTPPNSEDVGVTLLYVCQTRSAMGSCPLLSWTLDDYRAVPHAIPNVYASMTVTASTIPAMPGGTRAVCSVTFPTVGGVTKIRIQGYTEVGLKIVGGTNSLTINDLCDADTFGPYTPATGVWRYQYWFFHESTPPDGFPCSQASWTFSNQLTQGYQPSASTATCVVDFTGDYAPWSPTSTTCTVDNLGVYNIGESGTVTISLTADGCPDGPDTISVNIQCNDAESTPATWDGPMLMTAELDGSGNPLYSGETTLYTGSATWTGTGWDYRIIRKSDSVQMINNIVVAGDVTDPTGLYDYSGSQWDEECVALKIQSTEVT